MMLCLNGIEQIPAQTAASLSSAFWGVAVCIAHLKGGFLRPGLEGRDGKNRPDRGGQRAQYEALSRSAGGAWLSDLGHLKWFRGARSRAQASSRSHPDGYPASAGFGTRSHALDQGRSGAALDSRRRG